MSQLQTLAVFFSVAQERSFSAAAKKLGLSQPTISFHIDNLEKKMGCPLFVRTRRGTELTVFGRTLYESTIDVQNVLAKAKEKLQGLSDGLAGQITVGAGTIPGEYILPALLAKFLQNYPGIFIQLVTDDSRKVWKDFQAGKSAFCIIGFEPEGPEERICIWDDEIVLVTRQGSPLCSQPIINGDMIKGCPLVMRREGSASRAAVEKAFALAGLCMDDMRIVMEVSGNEAMKRALMAGAGLGFISKRAVEIELNQGQLCQIPIASLSIQRRFYAVRQKQLELPAANKLWDYLISNSSV